MADKKIVDDYYSKMTSESKDTPKSEDNKPKIKPKRKIVVKKAQPKTTEKKDVVKKEAPKAADKKTTNF